MFYLLTFKFLELARSFEDSLKLWGGKSQWHTAWGSFSPTTEVMPQPPAPVGSTWCLRHCRASYPGWLEYKLFPDLYTPGELLSLLLSEVLPFVINLHFCLNRRNLALVIGVLQSHDCIWEIISFYLSCLGFTRPPEFEICCLSTLENS